MAYLWRALAHNLTGALRYFAADVLALAPDGRRAFAGIGVTVRGFDRTADG